MSHECQHKSCSQESNHSHSDDHCQSCCQHHCHCDCHHHHQKYADQLLHLADEAWMEVVKEKIKDEIRRQSGEHITQIAQLVASSNQKRWKEKLAEKRDVEEFESQLKNLILRQKT